ncbi:E3 ubiquitin protein ligase DRIP2 [Daucus carota subsp. sativus]|uniref:RING-type domain-containing protein n=1 Tax=Daucus carota subsp. sativus TaxID=79200 RepID=A0A162ANU5_DAUCS|nr:PREDICTED: E3 ubiquitin protein ligase DRIP2-like [Daucus carota subsp. sativus]XP_017238268.1 PREDICTED: E3 ubiquitin protein ligase DRIP2-like [Daucus carota subsp. sativus]
MFKEMVSVKREALVACMTCPICNHIFRDATTISECLHTFCRKCICKKLSDEELERCPVCDIDLGVVPEEKLRPDHNLEDLRAKIFPYKRRKLDPSEDLSSFALPSRRKEKSLSSLVVNSPRVSSKTALTGRRSKAPVRKPLRGSSFSVEKQIKKEENFASFISRETPTKQNSSNGEPSSHSTPNIGTENGASTGEGKVNVWKPLNFLVEAANRNKSAKFTSQGSTSKSQPTNAAKAKQLAFRNKRKIEDENYSTGIHLPESRKPKRIQWLHHKKESTFGKTNLSPQEVLDACNIRHEKRLNPVWCSLVASKDLEDYRSLPQISASFLRIKDGSISVSFIQKYLMRKLNLPGEDEIEIRCRGEPVVPTLQLHKLIELWLQKISSSEKVSAKIGSSAKEFVMVLGYARKPPSA